MNGILLRLSILVPTTVSYGRVQRVFRIIRATRPTRRRTAIGILMLGLWTGFTAPLSAQEGPAFPVTFQGAIQHAINRYPAIQASAARVAAQESAVDLARTAYLPRIDSSLQLNRATRNNVAGLLLPGTTVPAISGPVSDLASGSMIWGSAASMLLSWEAFDFGQRGASVNVARQLVARANAGAELTRLEVAVKTAEAFLRLAAAEETIKAARKNVERQQIFGNAVGVMVRNQLRPGADDSRAQTELALANIQLIQAEQAEHSARAALAQWLGVAAADVRIATDPLLATPPATSGAAPVTSHPMAATQLAAIDSSRAVQGLLGRSYFPRINFQTAVALRGTGAAANGTHQSGGLDFKTSNWAFGVTATFPLFDVFSLREKARIEAQTERAERASYDRVLAELTTQAEQAQAEMAGARRVAEQTPIQLRAASALEQQSRARYDAGLATIIEVADAQRLLLQAEVSDAVAKLGVWRALVADAAARGDVATLLK